MLFLIVGDGPDRKMYEEFTKKCKVENRVTFVGSKENPYPYMNEADYVILTSDYEGFPVTYLEAITLNKNIITTIETSDESIDMKDIAYIIPKKENEMVEKVKDILKKKNTKKSINIDKIQGLGEETYGCQGGGVESGMNREFVVSRCKL